MPTLYYRYVSCNMKPRLQSIRMRIRTPDADIGPDAATDISTNADIIRMRVQGMARHGLWPNTDCYGISVDTCI
jgi:hypothetical protein